jgi:hypothetical protein
MVSSRAGQVGVIGAICRVAPRFSSGRGLVSQEGGIAMMKKTVTVGVVASTLLLGTGAVHAAPAEQGPSSSQSPYLVGRVPGVVTKSVLTTGDSIGGYRMAGIPDGLGAFDNGNGTLTVLMNHETASNLGIPRAHGAKGAFVSKWVVDTSTLQVLQGEDLIRRILRWNGTQWEQILSADPALALGRLCSADLPRPVRAVRRCERARHPRADLHGR